MGKQILICLVVVAVTVALFTPQCQADPDAEARGWDWGSLVNYAAKKLIDRWLRSGQVSVLGHTCRYSQVKFYNSIQDVDTYRGILACPGWTTITGEAVTVDGTKVKANTIADFLKKALNAGLITEDQAKEITQ